MFFYRHLILPTYEIHTHTNRTRATSTNSITPADNPLLPGWARVRWDNMGGLSNSYEIGAHGIYALNFSTSPPGPPRALAASAPPLFSSASSSSSAGTTTNGLKLTWEAPLDHGQPELTSYKVYRDGTNVHTTASASECFFHDLGVLPGTSYTYAVSAVNSAGT